MRAKPANQRRSQEKRDRLLTALEALLKRKPVHEITVAELAAKAKVSPATIYQRFSNEDATASVLLELYFQRVQEWATRPRSARPSATLFDALFAVARDAYDQVAELGHVMRPAYLYSRQHPDRVGPEWHRLEKIAVEGFKSFLNDWRDQVGTDDLDAAAQFLSYYFNVMTVGPLLHADTGAWHGLHERDAFARETATMAHRYLTAHS